MEKPEIRPDHQPERLIFHIDVNSAFLSWEAVRRMKTGEADLREIPSAIGGDPTKRTGIILAKSIPAKRYGVTTGEAVSLALQKCPDLVLAKPDFHLYQENSRKFMDICREYTPVLQKFSIDECFLDMSGTSLIYPDPVETACEIKDRIHRELGFTVNVGLGRNKLCAKMASDFEKPDKVHTLFPEEIPVKMFPLPIGDLFAVGRSTADKLRKSGIHTIGDAARVDLMFLQSICGKKGGEQIHRFANGLDDSEVTAEPEEAKGYNISTTLEEDVTDAAAAHNILLNLADSVTLRMRASGQQCTCISVTIRSNTFENHSHQRKLENPTDVTDEVYQISRELFDALWDCRTPLRLLGISLTGLTEGGYEQMSLFEDPAKKEKARKLDQALDAIRGKYGMDAVYRAGLKDVKAVGRKYRAQFDGKNQKSGEGP